MDRTGGKMNRTDELEILKIDMENIIAGMTICEGILSPEEHSHLALHKRCLSILKRIKPADEEETKRG